MRICNVYGCSNKHYSKGICQKHYGQIRRRGRLTPELEIERHGMARTSEYKSWLAMRNRCNNPNIKDYKNYGAIGITVCDSWQNSFVQFFNDMGEKPTPSHSIDRIENDKGYYKENCRWATDSQQSRNRGVFKNNKSGFKGVSLGENGKWRADITAKNKGINLGSFDNKEDAISARKKGELKYWNN